MKTQILLPNRYKTFGYILFVLGFILCIILLTNENIFPAVKINTWVLIGDEIFGEPVYFGIIKTKLIDEIVVMIFLIGAFITAFSCERVEDEFIAKTRLDSLLWATYVNYITLAIAIIFVHGTPFWTVMIFNMFTILIFFIIRFRWVLFKNNIRRNDEE